MTVFLNLCSSIDAILDIVQPLFILRKAVPVLSILQRVTCEKGILASARDTVRTSTSRGKVTVTLLEYKIQVLRTAITGIPA